jgi:hypothetical protein
MNEPSLQSRDYGLSPIVRIQTRENYTHVTFYALSEIREAVEIYGGTQSSGCIGAQGDVWFPSSRGPIHIALTQQSTLHPPPVCIDSGSRRRREFWLLGLQARFRLYPCWAPCSSQ